MSEEPRHWLDSEISSELRELLLSAEGDRAHEAQLAGLQAKLELALGPAFDAAADAGPEAQPQAGAAGSTAALGGGAAIGGALALATALMLGLGALWYGTRANEPRPAPAQPAPAALPANAEATPPAPTPVSSAPQLSQPSAAAPRAPQAVRPARQIAQGGGLVEELRQLEAIRRKLPSQPARALAAISAHARQFPQGALGPERELLKIEALQRLGRSLEARRAAEQALAREGQPYALQIRQLMAADGGSGQ
jgi:hypothetical protein